MSAPFDLAIVVAVHHAQLNLPDIVSNLRHLEYPNVEYLYCYTEVDPTTPDLVPISTNVKILCGAPGDLIPHMWRDGIMAASAERVATTTAQCVPAPDWVEHLLELDFGNAAGVGGMIENDPHADALGWAIFLQRYATFAPPQAPRDLNEIAADNAVYRRKYILRHQDLLDAGFWEPSFHGRFIAAGLALHLDPALRVVHSNRYPAVEFLRQRVLHGREFGMTRAAHFGVARRLVMIALAPMLIIWFLCKIIRRTRAKAHCSRQLPKSLPWLLILATAWIAGEVTGYAAVRTRDT